MILNDLLDIHELADIELDIVIKPGLMFCFFSLDEEGLGKEHTLVELADEVDGGWMTLIQSYGQISHLTDLEIPDYKIVERIFSGRS